MMAAAQVLSDEGDQAGSAGARRDANYDDSEAVVHEVLWV